MLLPKCPLCLTAWLTVATGVSFSAAAAAWLRGSMVLLWVGALGGMIWRRLFGRRLAKALLAALVEGRTRALIGFHLQATGPRRTGFGLEICRRQRRELYQTKTWFLVDFW